MAMAEVIAPSSAIKTGWTATPLIQEPTFFKVGGNDDFDPKKHLAYRPPSKVYTMKEIGLPEDRGVSPVAVSEPFPLFSPEAVMKMRAEVLSEDVMQNCKYSSNLAHCQLRGYADKYTPFIYDAWKHPETLKVISSIAGVNLDIQMDLEIGHINLSVKSEEEKDKELEAYNNNGLDEKPIVGWHTDSYPFVCVLMLSDCSEMIGGETALRTGSGDIFKVRGPQLGCGVVLQGRYIEHQALACFGATERITMVTSFRPASANVKDDTVLTTVRPISDLSDLYFQFSDYRLEILEERIRIFRKEMRQAKSTGRKFGTKRMKAFIDEQEKFLAHMNKEIVEDEKVVVGEIDCSHEFYSRNPKGERARRNKRARV